MPSTSPAQHRLMLAAAHDPAFARRVGVPQGVGAEFVSAGRHYATGGGVQEGGGDPVTQATQMMQQAATPVSSGANLFSSYTPEQMLQMLQSGNVGQRWTSGAYASGIGGGQDGMLTDTGTQYNVFDGQNYHPGQQNYAFDSQGNYIGSHASEDPTINDKLALLSFALIAGGAGLTGGFGGAPGMGGTLGEGWAGAAGAGGTDALGGAGLGAIDPALAAQGDSINALEGSQAFDAAGGFQPTAFGYMDPALVPANAQWIGSPLAGGVAGATAAEATGGAGGDATSIGYDPSFGTLSTDSVANGTAGGSSFPGMTDPYAVNGTTGLDFNSDLATSTGTAPAGSFNAGTGTTMGAGSTGPTVNGTAGGAAGAGGDFGSQFTSWLSNPTNALKLLTSLGVTGAGSGSGGGSQQTQPAGYQSHEIDPGYNVVTPGWRSDRPMYVPGQDAVPDGWYGAGHTA